MTSTTYDGRPIAREPPFGATVVVYRRLAGALQLLMLHRAHQGPDYEGDWAWTPPAGARWPGEAIEACAVRELAEETGLTLPLASSDHGTDAWPVYMAEAPAGAEMRLSAEHDRFAWMSVEAALACCAPEQAALPLKAAAAALAAAGLQT